MQLGTSLAELDHELLGGRNVKHDPPSIDATWRAAHRPHAYRRRVHALRQGKLQPARLRDVELDERIDLALVERALIARPYLVERIG